MLKLHFGCGMYPLGQDWIDSDLNPHAPGILMIDIREPLPYSADSADCIFHEHVLEHISIEEGMNFLGECYRVLKPGGTMRVITPSFEFLIALTNRDKTKAQYDYLNHMAMPLEPKKDLAAQANPDYQLGLVGRKVSATPCAVLNRFFRDWGHDKGFIYDERLLLAILRCAGFSSKYNRYHRYQMSVNPMLAGIDQHHKANKYAEMESLIIEVTKEK